MAEIKEDSMLQQMMKVVQDKRGATGALLASEFHKYQWGVKLPYLMMEYLFGLNVLPHPAIIELAGPPKSCKSAFLQYLLWLLASQDMGTVLIETEGKMSNTLLASILQKYQDRVIIVPGPLLQEEWQNEMLILLKLYRKWYVNSVNEAKKNKGKDKETPTIKPMLIGLDSLGGAPSELSVDAVDKAGSANRAFPVEAFKNKVYFEQLPTRIRDLPLTVVYTNHEKSEGMATKSFGPPGPKERTSKGGQTPDFFCGLRLFFEQATKMKEVRSNVFQQTLTIEVYKNSFNASGARIPLVMEWTITVNPKTNELTQKTDFLWNTALANLLAPGFPGFKYDREAVKKFLTVTRTSETKFSCKELSLKDVPPEDIGAAIEANPKIKAKLRPYLGIKSWNVWTGKPITESTEAEVSLPDPEEAVKALLVEKTKSSEK